jgi:hypothetical protein
MTERRTSQSRRTRSALALAALTLVGATSPAVASGAEGGERVVVSASDRYRANGLHRIVLGGGYRDLWQAPVSLPVLDLEHEGGGLVPTRRFGGLQTPVLGFAGADGRLYSFRGTDKDPSAVLDPLLHDTLIQAVVQDQMAAQHPGGPPTANVLTEAAGVLTVRERLVVMPDDPRLGEFRSEFAGRVGTFFEYPQPSSDAGSGFHGALEILDHEELYAALATGDTVEVDARAFLRARLLDLLLGDFDRHRKQWRWASFAPGTPLQPIPEDRDMAFVRYEGIGPRTMKIYIPILQRYDADYPFIKGLTMHGWEQDRWLLPALSWADWEPLVADIQARLDDATIERAVAALPPEYAALDGARLAGDIRGRREGLGRAARRYYEHLAREVDVQTSDAAHTIRVTRSAGGRTRIRVQERAASPNEPSRSDGSDGAADATATGRILFDREFRSSETKEIRLYLRGGDDEVLVEGGRGRIRLHLIAGPGTKRVDDRAGGGTRIHDEAGGVLVLAGRGTRIDRKPYVPPPADSGFVDVEDVPPRDWGSDTIPIPEFGLRGRRRRLPRPRRRAHALRLPQTPLERQTQPRLRLGDRGPRAAPPLRGPLPARELEAAVRTRSALFRHRRAALLRRGQRVERPGQRSRLPRAQRAVPPHAERPDPAGRLAHPPRRRTLRPVLADVQRRPPDRRARPLRQPPLRARRRPRGISSSIPGARSRRISRASSSPSTRALPPAIRRAASCSTSPHACSRRSGTSRRPTGRSTARSRAISRSSSGIGSRSPSAPAASRTSAASPSSISPTSGGGRFFSGASTNRGFRTRRFAGDASVYGNTDLRIVLFRPKIIVPGDFGIQGFADVGRVFVDDENSDDWHPSGGGGIWFSPLVRTNTISLSVADSPEETLAYFRFGFHY